MSVQTTTVEVVIGGLASRQHGVVTRRQLLGAGVTTHQIQHRLDRGALLCVYRGVYRVGHRAPSVEARYLAAVLACGDGARLSGRAAAHLFGLLKGPVPPPAVTTPLKRRVAGVELRRGRIEPPDRAIHRGIPITAVPRTLADLAADLSLDDLARACHEAGVRYRTTPAHVEAVLARRPANTPGAPKLRQVISGDVRVTLSALEAGSWSSYGRTASNCRRPTVPPARTASTADGPRAASPSSSTATASTTHATPGSRTDGVSARPAPAATSSVATRGATCSTPRARCSRSSAA